MTSIAAAEMTERRIRLRDQLLVAGPDHTDMRNWFTIPDGSSAERWDDPDLDDDERAAYDGRGIDWAPVVNFDACGTAACLAGHGAYLMLPDVVNDPAFVAEMFGLDEEAFGVTTWDLVGWRDFNLGAEYDARLRAGDTDRVAQWGALVAYLDHLIKEEG